MKCDLNLEKRLLPMRHEVGTLRVPVPKLNVLLGTTLFVDVCLVAVAEVLYY